MTPAPGRLRVRQALPDLSRYVGTDRYTIGKSFVSDFENDMAQDFAGYYIENGNPLHDHQALDTAVKRTGASSFQGWITAANLGDSHRAYPTVQMYKGPGVFYGVTVTELWVMLDGIPPPGVDKDWASFATLTAYADDIWGRTLLANVDSNGFAHLMHLPGQGEHAPEYEPRVLPFPTNQWVKLNILADYRGAIGPGGVFLPGNTAVGRLWQNDVLISAGHFNPRISDPSLEGPNGLVYMGGLCQAHFGLYAARLIPSGRVWNDRLAIYEVIL